MIPVPRRARHKKEHASSSQKEHFKKKGGTPQEKNRVQVPLEDFNKKETASSTT
jgi:hypothetical protein